MIQTVIFDIGRVLIGFEWTEYVHALFGNPAVEAEVTDATFGSGIWNEMDRGVWSEEEVLALALKQNFVPIVDDRNCFCGIVTRQGVIGYLAEQLAQLRQTEPAT